MAEDPASRSMTEAIAELREYGSHVLRGAWNLDHLAHMRETIVRFAALRAERIARGEPRPLDRMLTTHGAGFFTDLTDAGLMDATFLSQMFVGTPYHRLCVDYYGDDELYVKPNRLGFRLHDPAASDRSFVPFHQDSGTSDRRILDVLNCWIPLDPGAGAQAPGLEVVRSPCERNFPLKDFGLLSGNAAYDNITIDPEAVQAAYGDRLSAPVFELGDGLVFTHHVIHRTHVTPAMTRPRLNFEFRVCSLRHLAPGVTPDDIRQICVRVA